MVGVGSLHFVWDLGLLICVVSAAGAWMTAGMIRFILLQVPAFEVWYNDALVYSGLDEWRSPHPNRIIQELEKLGVAVTCKQPSCAAGGG